MGWSFLQRLEQLALPVLPGGMCVSFFFQIFLDNTVHFLADIYHGFFLGLPITGLEYHCHVVEVGAKDYAVAKDHHLSAPSCPLFSLLVHLSTMWAVSWFDLRCTSTYLWFGVEEAAATRRAPVNVTGARFGMSEFELDPQPN